MQERTEPVAEELPVDRAIYLVDRTTRTYRSGGCNPGWAELDRGGQRALQAQPRRVRADLPRWAAEGLLGADPSDERVQRACAYGADRTVA